MQTKKVRRKASPSSESVGEGEGGNGRVTASGNVDWNNDCGMCLHPCHFMSVLMFE